MAACAPPAAASRSAGREGRRPRRRRRRPHRRPSPRKEGHEADVYERWPGLGGQAATIDIGDGVLVERYYHHLFTSDREIAELCEEIGLGTSSRPGRRAWRCSTAASCYPFTSPLDLLRYKPMSPLARVRMGFGRAAAAAPRATTSTPFEAMTIKDWVRANMGKPGLGDGLGADAARQVRRPGRRDLDVMAVGEAAQPPPGERRGGEGREARLPARQLRVDLRTAPGADRRAGRPGADRPPGRARRARRRRRLPRPRRRRRTRSGAATTRASSRSSASRSATTP